MTKDQLLLELSANTFVRIRPSKIHGIGVFAIRNIPQSCRDMFLHEPGEWRKISRAEVADLPEASRLLIEEYCLFDEDHYYVPAQGFKTMDISLFLNHSESPNIISINDGEYFESLREIKIGEELFIDYGTLVDSPD